MYEWGAIGLVFDAELMCGGFACVGGTSAIDKQNNALYD
jgi:hypothetical protein